MAPDSREVIGGRQEVKGHDDSWTVSSSHGSGTAAVGHPSGGWCPRGMEHEAYAEYWWNGTGLDE